MPLAQTIVTALRSLRACPWESLARRRAPLLEVPHDLAGVSVPLIDRGACDPPGATWMPQLGLVAWEADPDAHAERDLLRRWSRGRLREALHAARVGDAAFALARVEAFLRRCPPGACDHWSSGMEVALRAMRLLHAGAHLRESRAGASLEPIARALALHEQALQSATDWRLHRTGNHYLVALAARVVLSASLPPCAERARRLGRDARLLTLELARQLGPDGLHFESSTHYHVLVVEAAAHASAALRMAGREPAAEAIAALVRVALPSLLRPDGTVAGIGDSDDESFVPPPADAAPDPGRAGAVARALGVGATMRPDAFPAGGLVVLASPSMHVTASATGPGRGGSGGHAHDDVTSYDLWCDGPLVVHRGTGAYAADLGLRERLRSIAAHAALQVDGRAMNGSVPGRAFRRRHHAHAFLASFDGGEHGSAASIGHHGFATPAPAIFVLRTLRLDGARLRVEDAVEGSSEHELTLRLPWAPGIEVASREGALHLSRDGTLVATCAFESGAALHVETLEEDHWPRQGERTRALTTVARCRARLPARIVHVIEGRSRTPGPKGAA